MISQDPDTINSQERMIRLLGVLCFLVGMSLTYRHTRISDFPVDAAVYQEGARAFLHGTPLYTQLMHVGNLHLPFIYPPFGALFLTPLLLFGMGADAAGNVIAVVSSVILAFCCYFAARAITPHHRLSTQLALGGAFWTLGLLMEPVWLNDSFGQINVIIMGLVVLDLVPRRRWLPQGWLIGVAAAIKISPLAMLLYFLLRKEWKPIVTAVCSGAIATLLATVLRFSVTREYIEVLFGMGASGDVGVDPSYTSNSSLKAMVMRWFPSKAVLESDSGNLVLNIIWIVLVILTIAAGAILMHKLIHRGWNTDAWQVNAVVMLLISPISWSHHWVWLTLILPVSAHHIVRHRSHHIPLAVVTVVWLLCVLTNPPKWWFGDGIDAVALGWFPTVLVSDFVWLGLAWIASLFWLLRGQPEHYAQPEHRIEHDEDPAASPAERHPVRRAAS